MFAEITIAGNTGSEPEMRFTPSGKPVCSFSVATSRRYTKDGERKEETQWYKVITWGKLAENCNQYLDKGRQVLVVGSPRLREWEGQDGQKHANLEINAREVKFLGKAKADGLAQDAEETEPEDIPF